MHSFNNLIQTSTNALNVLRNYSLAVMRPK